MLGLPAPFVPHSASLSPATATRVLSTLVPVSAPPTSLDECLFSISLVSVPLAVRFSVSSGCARRRSVSTYAAILVPPSLIIFNKQPGLENTDLYIQLRFLIMESRPCRTWCQLLASSVPSLFGSFPLFTELQPDAVFWLWNPPVLIMIS